MRLRKITLHGYKTFANKTELIFEGGITAIVGPNGSGKSNIADAIRWVLGEQAYTLLRGKKTEDMIFNGSNERARMGMAEVTITLDNSDNFLPIAFDEVSIGRRAYRSGENEYFLNGNRVRLRDVLELLDRSGLGRRTHTVIGQGMIDQALALRPEDRRQLFEEAAGITLYRQKRQQTLDRLAQTQDNLTRVHDILAEIGPRLRQLERQAERALQYESISHELRGQLLLWYGFTWRQALGHLVDAKAAVAHWQGVIERSAQNITAYNAETTALRSRQTDLRGHLADLRRQMATQEQARAAMAQEQAVGQERLQTLRDSTQRLQHEIALLIERQRGEDERVQEAEQVQAEIEAQRRQQHTQLAQAQQDLHAQEQERLHTQQALADVQRRHFDLSARLADRSNRIQQSLERRSAVQAEHAQDLEAAAAAGAEAAGWQTQFDTLAQELQGLGQRMHNLRQQHRQAEARRDSLLAARTQTEMQRAEMEAQLRGLQARFELLDRLRAEGEGLFLGVKNVLQAANPATPASRRQGPLPGILGPVSALIRVPPALEHALDVALGARIQDVVVRTWQDAEQAIAYLKQTRGGRATFLPLDNLRPAPRRAPPPGQGVLGWAADLVAYEAEVAPAMTLLLGHILVVEDLDAARRVSRAADRPRIVTLAGDFVHPGGSVSGGSQEERQRGGLLAREREWRDLPGQMAAVEAQLRQRRSDLEQARHALAAVDEDLTRLVREASQAGEEERQRAAALSRLQNNIDKARQKELWHQERGRKLALELEELGRRLAGLRQESGELSSQQEALAHRQAALEEKLATLDTSGLLRAAAQAQARLDAVEEMRRSQQALVASHAQAAQQTRAESHARSQRSQALATEMAALQARLQTLQSEHAAQDASYLALLAQIEPAQTALDALDQGWPEHDRRGEGLRQRLHQEELQLSQSRLAQQRAEDHLTYLRSQIEHDFGLVALETEAGVASQEPLPFDRIVTALPQVDVLPTETEQEMRRLKGLLSRLGAVNLQAKAEYASAKERFDFLTAQAADLQESSAQLLQVIAELDKLIDQEFRRTFTAVSKAFTRYFTRLFGGGTAKLTLIDINGGEASGKTISSSTTTGVEIIARPPGKRPTQLSMLSGGERALTAAALIFAVLSVSPAPFCVLDEVDAALDEANVGRVRQVLQELAAGAQFVVITHNRGTVEVADTIYGVSMGQDSVSQTLSLRLRNGRLEEAAL